MGKHVLLEVISKCAGINALVTGEGLLSIVRQHVPLQVTSLSAFVVALIAAEGLLSTML